LKSLFVSCVMLWNFLEILYITRAVSFKCAKVVRSEEYFEQILTLKNKDVLFWIRMTGPLIAEKNSVNQQTSPVFVEAVGNSRAVRNCFCEFTNENISHYIRYN